MPGDISDAVELLPCPFCAADVGIASNSSGLIGEDWPRGCCSMCGTLGPVSGKMNDRNEAARLWNTRALIKPSVEDAERHD